MSTERDNQSALTSSAIEGKDVILTSNTQSADHDLMLIQESNKAARYHLRLVRTLDSVLPADWAPTGREADRLLRAALWQAADTTRKPRNEVVRFTVLAETLAVVRIRKGQEVAYQPMAVDREFAEATASGANLADCFGKANVVETGLGIVETISATNRGDTDDLSAVLGSLSNPT